MLDASGPHDVMSPRRILVALSSVALLLLVALAVMLWRSHRADATAPRSLAFDGDVRAVAPLESTVSDATHVPIGERRAARVSAPTSTTPRPLARPDDLRIVVLASDTREPIPGAVVRTWDCPSDGWGLTLNYDSWVGPSLERHMTEKGREYVTDEHGEVDLPPSRRNRFVTARSGDRSAFLRFQATDHGSAEMLLVRRHDIRVRVLDERRAPRPHVVVTMANCSDDHGFWKTTTDERGECQIEHVELLWEELGTDLSQPVAIFAGVPCLPRVEEWIDPLHLPGGVVELVLPATGSMIVRVVDERGHTVPVQGEVTWASWTESTRGRPAFGSESVVALTDLVDGVARIDDVGLGLRLAVEADVHGTGDVSIEIAGPTVVNEVVNVSIPFAPDHTLLLARVVDEAGHPLANREFDWRRILDDGVAIQASGRDTLRTDSEGRFTWTLRRSAADTGASTHRTGFLCEVAEGDVRAQAVVRFPLEIGTAVTDLGDVVAARRGPLVRGRVVDEADRGVQGILVLPRLHDAVGFQDAETFDAQITDAEGRFAMFGPCLGLDLRVHAEGIGIVDPQVAAVPCREGTVDVTLHARSFGHLEGSALVDHEAGDELVVRFESRAAASRPDAPVREPEEATWWRAGDRICFRFDAVEPGLGRVSFLGSDPTAPCVVVDDVEITSGEVSRPASLVDVDLRGKLAKRTPEDAPTGTLEFTVVDAGGRPIPRGVVWVWRADDDGPWEHFFAGGRSRPDIEGLTRLEFWAPGHRAVVLRAPFVERRVVLGPMYEIEVRLQVPRELSDERCSFTGRIWQAPQIVGETSVPVLDGTSGTVGVTAVPSQAAARFDGFRFDRKGRAAAGLPVSGSFGIAVELTRQAGENDSVSDYTIMIEPGTFVVREVDGRQVLDVRFTPEGLKQCLDDLGLSK